MSDIEGVVTPRADNEQPGEQRAQTLAEKPRRACILASSQVQRTYPESTAISSHYDRGGCPGGDKDVAVWKHKRQASDGKESGKRSQY